MRRSREDAELSTGTEQDTGWHSRCHEGFGRRRGPDADVPAYVILIKCFRCALLGIEQSKVAAT